MASDDPARHILHRTYQFAALIFAPFMVWIGMMLIRVLHDVAITIVNDIVGGRVLAREMLAWLVHLAALGAFVGLMWLVYQFVKNKGWGLFED